MIRSALLGCFVVASTAAFAETPSDAVKFFYTAPLKYEGDPALRDRFTDPAKKLFDENDKVVDSGEEVGCLDFSPGIDAQDYDEAELMRTLELTEAVKGDSAEVTARFTLFPGTSEDGAKREMLWTLKKAGNGWKIADIASITSKWKLSEIKCDEAN